MHTTHSKILNTARARIVDVPPSSPDLGEWVEGGGGEDGTEETTVRRNPSNQQVPEDSASMYDSDSVSTPFLIFHI